MELAAGFVAGAIAIEAAPSAKTNFRGHNDARQYSYGALPAQAPWSERRQYLSGHSQCVRKWHGRGFR